MKKKLLWFLLAALMLLLASCGESTTVESTTRSTERPSHTTTEATTEPVTIITTQTESEAEQRFDPALAGHYVCIASYWQGESCGADESWYELRADGTGTEFLVSQWEFTWESDGNIVLMVDETGVETRGVIDGDTLTVEDAFLGTKTVYSRKPPEEVPTESITQATEQSTSTEIVEYVYDYWNRGWYGWWVVEEGFGAYADWGDGSYWWDCCADITLDGNGTLDLTLWDEDGSRQEPMAEVRLRLEPTEGSYGTVYSTGGHFWEMNLGKDEWKINPDDAVYDELLVLEGYYAAPGSKGDAFYYTVYLRPWGKLWDDWYADEPDCLPGYYESWYLPKLAEGILTLPDRIK